MKALSPVEDKVVALIDPVAEAMGYRIVRVRLSGLRRKTLQIMAERLSDGDMGVGDCAKLSRALNPVLDESDPVQGEYSLEVSSPGIDRPLVREDDFTRFVGHEAKLETAALVDGRKRFRGAILGMADGYVRLLMAEGEASVPFGQLCDARLVLTDKLIEEDLRRAKAAEADEQQGLELAQPTDTKVKTDTKAKRKKPS
ncbi:MAG: ribosome maturation factor RimP [Caulobacterales bacterium]